MSEAGLIHAFTSMPAGAQGIWLFGTVIVSGQLLKWFNGWLALRKLSVEERQANREGFTAQVELLSRQLNDAAARLSALQARYDGLQREHDDYRVACRGETDQLRAQIVHAENEIVGLRRQLTAAAVAAAHGLAAAAAGAPLAAASIERVERFIERGTVDKPD